MHSIGKDFDFAANTERFSSAFGGAPDRSDQMISEEEAFFVKQPTTRKWIYAPSTITTT